MKKSPWVSLFNGKDLKGWVQLNGKAKFEAVDNEIVGTTVPGEPNSFLATETIYQDFILELEFKGSAMNSGIQFRSESKAEYMQGAVHGYQCDIDPSERAWTGGIYDEKRRLWLYPLEYNPAAKTAYKKDEWNSVRIECIGHVMRTFINGIPTAHLVDDLTPRGFIALQVHAINKPEEAGRQVRFRNIRIQTTDLKPSPVDGIFVANFVPNTVTDQEKANGVRLLWDGQTTNGWRGAYASDFPAKGWKIADGMISVQRSDGAESRNGGDIVSTETFSAFDLQFEFRLSEGANSGVKYFVTEKEN
ncbi:MAG TPA: DUF1080 domain-containing protein, partial [Chryseosolibacter sp.]|nr:DUF1080 domain-containing protein [Chryseosolibacter sp.]